MQKAFLICPVRNNPEYGKKYVEEFEADGWVVHWPVRDTNQNDDTGLRICRDNYKAIMDADVVLFVWDGKSQGCLFDLGMAFALDKVIWPISLPHDSGSEKSFVRMIRAYADTRPAIRR